MTRPAPRPVATSYGRAVVAGEKAYIIASSYELWDGTSPAILAHHGADGTELFISPTVNSGVNFAYLQYIAAQGFIVISSLWGGELWGNTTNVAKLKEGRDWAVANGAKNGPVGLYLGSGGAPGGLNFLAAYPDLVDAAVLVVPAVNLDSVYADLTDQQADMDAAYSGDYATNGSPRSPHNIIASIRNKAHMRAYYATDDTSIRPHDVASFSSQMGIPYENIGPGGHGALSSYRANVEDMLALYEALR